MIIWLASYPRSGNTLLRLILKNYFNQTSFSKYNDKADIGANTDFSKLVGHETYAGKWDEFYRQAGNSKDVHFVKTHDGPEDDGKAIYIVRDGRAVSASYLKYLSQYSNLKFDIQDVISGAVSFGSWAGHIEKWNPGERPNTLFLRYEDLVLSPQIEIEKISKFLEINPVVGELPSFEFLKGAHPKFFQSGTNEKNIASISDDDYHYIMLRFGKRLKQLGYIETASFDLLTANLVQEKFNAKLLSYKREIHKFQQSPNFESLETSIENLKGDLRKEIAEKIEFVRNANEAMNLKQDEFNKSHLEVSMKLTSLEDRIDTYNLADMGGHVKNLVTKIDTCNLVDVGKHIENLVSKNEKITDDIADLRTSQNYEKGLADISHKYIQELEGKISNLSSAITTAHAKILQEEKVSGQLRTNLKKLAENYDSIREKLFEYEYVLEPRYKSLLQLRPLKHILSGRRRIKNNGKNAPLDSALRAVDVISDRNLLAANETQNKTYITNSVKELPRVPHFNTKNNKEELGIAVYTFDRKDMVHNVLESLAQQDVLDKVHVWIDGDQGNVHRRKTVDETEALVRQYPVKAVSRNRGNFGFRKMMLTSQGYMLERYENIIFLEDDCFPCEHAIESFSKELEKIQNDPSIFSVYGHPFLVPGEGKSFGRFQGWGWATTSKKLEPILKELFSLYLLTEEEYLGWVKQNLTPDLRRRIDVTPGRSPLDTIENFFAWDEVLCMITAMHGLNHKRTEQRLIYNCGVGASSAHFSDIEHYKQPPFNMVSPDEVWDYF